MIDMGGQLHFQADWDDAINIYKDASAGFAILFVVSLEDYRYVMSSRGRALLPVVWPAESLLSSMMSWNPWPPA
jgi:hypothetical protein